MSLRGSRVFARPWGLGGPGVPYPWLQGQDVLTFVLVASQADGKMGAAWPALQGPLFGEDRAL